MMRITYALSAVVLALGTLAQADSSWLYGVHWASEPADNDLETMTGGKGIWVVDQCMVDSNATLAENNIWETPWVTTPAINKTTPYYKPGYFSTVIARGHSMICRLGPQYGTNIPHPSNPYTTANYADDCKAAANLMKDVRIWQIGNEVNLREENYRWNAGTSDYDTTISEAELASAPELYAAVYVACRDKIHEVTPLTSPAQQVVLMQPCSPGAAQAWSPSGATRFMDSNEFLARMIAAVPDKSKIDGISLHTYAEPGGSNFGADSCIQDLKTALMIIDQAGLGDRPVFITEFNKHMPNATEAAIGAKFCSTAFQLLNSWNVGAAKCWPGQPNHSIRGPNWFVYRNDPFWGPQYSLFYWKTNALDNTVANNPWYAYQNAAAQNYPAGATGPDIAADNVWWEDTFSGGAVDQAEPLPEWVPETGSDGQVTLSGSGAMRLVGSATTGYTNASIKTPPGYQFTDFQLLVDVTFTNASRVADDEANFDLRIRENINGYSLTFYSSNSSGPAAARAGHVYLRRTGLWDTVYRSAPIPGGINSGDRFRVVAKANGSSLEYQVIRLSNGAVVLDWTGANQVVSSDHRLGGVRAMTWNMREAQIDLFRMGGLDADLVPTAAEHWSLFE